MRKIRKDHSNGFTLIELMVTLAVVAIIATFAIPGMGKLLDKMAVQTTTDTLVEAIRTARVTAVEQKIRTRVCGLASDNSCSAAAADWDRGIVVVKVNDDDSLETLHMLKFSDSVFIRINGANYTIHVNRQGWTSGSADTILVCKEPGSNKYSHRVVLSRAGRVTTVSYDKNPWSSGLDC